MAARPDIDNQTWKKKYYASLAELDSKEQEWGRVEALLYRSLSRLSLAAYGGGDQLDRKLDDLRSALRERRDGEHVAALVDRVEQANATAGKSEEGVAPEAVTIGPDAATVLLNFLGALDFPPAQAKRAGKLARQLAAVDALARIDELTASLAGLIREALEEADRESAAVDRDGSGSLIKRLFGGNAAPDAGADPMARALIVSILEGLAGTRLHDPELVALSRIVAQTSDVKALSGLVNKLTARLVEALDDGAGPATAESRDTGEDAGTASIHRLHAAVGEDAGDDPADAPSRAERQSAPGPADPSLAELLTALIDRLDLPETLTSEVARLRETATLVGTGEQAFDVMAAVAALVSGHCESMRRERGELEQFLEQLTERLAEIESFLHGCDESASASGQDQRVLQSSVANEMRDLQEGIADANDVDILKQVVTTRVSAIEGHVGAYLRAESARREQSDIEIKTLAARVAKTERESVKLRRRLAQAQARASRDGLTEIYNRAAFDERIAEEFARWSRHGGDLSLILWDLDHFKRINDTYGHAAGDKVLRSTARIVTGRVRESDFFARYGGEEFALLLPGTTLEAALAVGDQLRIAVAKAGFRYHGERVNVTASAGIAAFRNGDSPERVLARADAALYRAKDAGRNCCEPEQL